MSFGSKLFSRETAAAKCACGSEGARFVINSATSAVSARVAAEFARPHFENCHAASAHATPHTANAAFFQVASIFIDLIATQGLFEIDRLDLKLCAFQSDVAISAYLAHLAECVFRNFF